MKRKDLNMGVLVGFGLLFYIVPRVNEVTEPEYLFYNTLFWVCFVGFFVLNGSKGED